MKLLVKFAQNLWLWYHFQAIFGMKMGLLFKSQRHVFAGLNVNPYNDIENKLLGEFMLEIAGYKFAAPQ